MSPPRSAPRTRPPAPMRRLRAPPVVVADGAGAAVVDGDVDAPADVQAARPEMERTTNATGARSPGRWAWVMSSFLRLVGPWSPR